MIDLQKGTTLIEASAGTGKTYTLCRIALQLTVQRGITLDRILAVTFTEAATEELASRIHELYQNCLRELDTDNITEPILLELIAEEGFNLQKAKNDLRYSLEVFDEAPISTIHSFCKRSLELVALETQTPLDAELSQIENELIEQLQNEYIRQNILEASTALSSAIGKQADFAKRLNELGRQTASHPDAVIRPKPTPLSIESLDRRFNELPSQLTDLIERQADYLPHLGKASKILKAFNNTDSPLHAAAKRGVLLPSDLVTLQDFNSAKWGKAIKKSGAGLPVPPAVTLIDTIQEQTQEAFTSLIFNYRSWLSEHLAAAKLQANVISFNDLLHLLWRALREDQDSSISTFLSARYDAALIDEFQDTDRTQLQIAQKLFGTGEHYLFYIGDPKQAIYRFRGADIYAYFQATQGGNLKQITLKQNHRSSPQLVQAVNHLFNNAKSSFVDERIHFSPVEAARNDLAPDHDNAPFVIHQLVRPSLDKPPGKGEYRKVLSERAANDFAERLNNNNPTFNSEDVTFLVNDKLEANDLSEALLQRGIPCAILADRSVFQTQEAADLKQLLASLASPARGNLKRGAYACLNHSIDAVSISRDSFETEAMPFMEFITEWARDWFDHNFNVAFNRLTELGRSDSSDLDTERRYANFCQLAELLSEARDAEELSPRGLYNWLSRKENTNVSQNADWQTRISSDSGKPQILTIHKSKGLQFPIVILPFVGLKRIRQKQLATTYHGADDELIIDFAPEDDSPELAHFQRETLAEDVRLLYVALTRAVHENTVYLCPEEIYNNTGCSSFAQFLLDQGSDTPTEAVGDILQNLATTSKGALSFKQHPYETGTYTSLDRPSSDTIDTVSARSLQNRHHLPGPERVLSFSALSKNLHHDTALPILEESEQENDEDEITNPEPESEISIFTLPKGTRAGDLLHLILERFDFSKPEILAATTQQAFESLQFEPQEFEPIVAAQIGAIAKIELPCRFGNFRLEQIPPKQRIAELEFSYPVHGDVKTSIIAALQTTNLGTIPKAWVNGLANSEHGLTASMLRGFIDLVLERDGRLYIFDWKSNYLGDTPANYDQSAMHASMADHNYYLQYLLYCVALKRYIARRFPSDTFESHFGGVFYIYARGISPGKQTGIYHDLPSTELLEALDQALGGIKFSHR